MNREAVIQELAKRAYEAMDLDALEESFIDHLINGSNFEGFNTFTDEQLKTEFVELYGTEEEFNELANKVG